MSKKTLIILIVFLIIIAVGIFLWQFQPKKETKDISLPVPDKLNDSEVVIYTDKAEYDKGEVIEITVKNNLGTPIFYSSWDGRFWDITPFDIFFQLGHDNIGKDCHMVFYEEMPPVEVEPGASFSTQWNQKICPLDPTNPAESGIVKYIESGQYKLVFTYGIGLSNDEAGPYHHGLLDPRTIYSNSFTIR